MSDKGTKVAVSATPTTKKELLAAISSAMKARTHRQPSRKQLSLIWAQWALETGRGKSCWNYNIGNIRGVSPESKKYIILDKADEIIDGQRVITGGSFRAYDSLEEGARDYISVLLGGLQGGDHGWKALTTTENPDAQSFVQGLKDDKYFTADVVQYSKSVDSLSRECMAKTKEDEWPDGADEEPAEGDWHDWNELVDSSRRYESPCKGNRPASITKPTHIVIHITGTSSFQSVKNRFMTPKEASAHYLVDQEGNLHQFVTDSGRAWHAGISAAQARLYNKNDGSWRKYKKYFSWSKYPAGSQYFDGQLNKLPSAQGAALVGTADGGNWSDYDYFDKRWGALNQPFYYDQNVDPNNYSIGIELLTEGYSKADAKYYPEALYAGLDKLLANLCKKYDIPRDRKHIIGHEDVDPCSRWGWDPNQGFDWDRVLTVTESSVEPEDDDHGRPVQFDLASMTEDQRYEHLKGVWKRAQERFGHEGDSAYDFQEEKGRVNLIGARGLLPDKLEPVPNTRSAWDDTMFVVYKDENDKKRVRTFVFSTEPNDPKGTSHTSTLTVGMHKYMLGTHHKKKTRVRINGLASYPGSEARYRALNPIHAVTYLDGNGNVTEDPGEHFGHDAAINMHYGGSAATSTWSHGCQVFKGWAEYVEFIRLVESDASIKGSIDNDIAPKPSSDGSRAVIYLLIEGNLLKPVDSIAPIQGLNAPAHYALNEKGDGGYFPIGANNFWHGGMHFDVEAPVVAVFDGEVVAYRATQQPLEVELGGVKMPMSDNFVLIRHTYKTPKGQEIIFYSLYMHLLPLGNYSPAQKAAAPSPFKKRSFVVATQEDGKGLNVRDAATGKTVLGVIPKDAHFDVVAGSVASWNASYKEVSYEGLKGFALIDTKRAEKVADGKYRCLTKEDKPADTNKLGLAVRENGNGSRVLRILPKGTTLTFKSPNEIAPGGALAVGWHQLEDGGWVYVRAGQNPSITSAYTIEPEALDKVVETKIPITAGAIVGHAGPYLSRTRTLHFEIILKDAEFLTNPKGDKGGATILQIPAETAFKKRTKPKAETIAVSVPAGSRIGIVGRDRVYRKVVVKEQTGWAPVDALGTWDKNAEVFVLKKALTSLFKKPPGDAYQFTEDAGKNTADIDHPLPVAGSAAISWDESGHAWYEVEYAPGQKGWIDPDQPGVEKKCVFDWPGWQKIEESSDFSDDGLCDAAEIVSLIDEDGDHNVTAKELKKALENPIVAAKLRKIACVHPTEWSGEIKGIKRLSSPPWNLSQKAVDATTDYIKKLGFWKDVKKAELPSSDKVWNVHPIGFLEHLRTLERTAAENATCSALEVKVWKKWREDPRAPSNTDVIQFVPESMLKDAKTSVDLGKSRDMIKDWKRLNWKQFVEKYRKGKPEEKKAPNAPAETEQNVSFAFSKAPGKLALTAALESKSACANTRAHSLVLTGPDGKATQLVPSGGEFEVAFSGEDSSVETVVPKRYHLVGKACDGSGAGVMLEVYPASFFLFEYSIEQKGEIWRKLADRINAVLKAVTGSEISLKFSGGVAGFFGWRDEDESWRAYYAYELSGKGGVELTLSLKFSFVQWFSAGLIPPSFSKYAADIGLLFEVSGGVALELKAEIRRFPKGATDLGWKPVLSAGLNLTIMVSLGLYARAGCVIVDIEVVGKVKCGVSGGGTLAWKNNQLSLTPSAALEPGNIIVTLTLSSWVTKHEYEWRWELWPKKDLLKNADAWLIYDGTKKSK